MERKLIFKLVAVLVFVVSCKEQQVKEVPVLRDEPQNKRLVSDIEAELKEAGYLTINYVDDKTKDTVIMQQYFIAFLKSGPNRDQSPAESDSLQQLHLAHLGRMYELGYADISGLE